jgi:hypothetical protein
MEHEGPNVPTFGGTASDPTTPAELTNPQLHETQFKNPAAVSLW